MYLYKFKLIYRSMLKSFVKSSISFVFFFVKNQSQIMSAEKKRRVENLFPDVLDAWKAVFGESSFCRALPAAYELLDAVNCGSLNWPHGQIVSPVNGVSKSFVAMLVWLVQRKERKMGESTDSVLKRSVQEYFGVTSFTATMALDLKNKAMPTRENLEPTVRRFSKSYGALGRFRGSAVKAVTSLADLRAFFEAVGAGWGVSVCSPQRGRCFGVVTVERAQVQHL